MRVKSIFLIIALFSSFLYSASSLGGLAWYDKNIDGIKDYGEFGIGRVRVHLLKDGQETGDINYTDLGGNYLFENLEPNHNYAVKVVLPINYVSFTKPNVGSDDSKDSDIINITEVEINGKKYTAGISEEIYLEDEMHIRDLDAGLICKCIAWIDIEKYTNGKDADSADEAIEVKVGDEITWEYLVRNSSKVKISNIKVIDDQEGEITCPEDELEPGEEMKCYKSGIAKEGLYENKVIVTGEDENNTQVSDEDISHYIAKNELGCIGNFYWYDENLNGVQDQNEPGIIGIEVGLYDKNKNLLQTTKTDNEGKYLFCDLEPGEYYVKFGLPNTYLFTPPDRGSDIVDSDANSDGWSHLITLAPGEINLTIDTGIYCECDDYMVAREGSTTTQSAKISFANIIIVSFIMIFILLTLNKKNKKGY